jgi:hypothetical protein
LVTSTASEIDRMPDSVSRRWISSGVGAAGSSPVTVLAENRSQPTGSSISTGQPSPSGGGTVTSAAGSRYAASKACESSRAMPRTDIS